MRNNAEMSETLVRADAAARLGVAAETLTISRHDQLFSSTACGFPGLGGAAMTTAEVVVAEAPVGGACVYVAGRLCYRVAEPNEAFSADLAAKKLLPAYSYKGQYDQRPQPEEDLFTVKGSTRPPTTFDKALERAYDRARPGYGIKRAAKPATVVRVGDGVTVCQLLPVDAGAGSPEYVFAPEAAAYTFAGRFPSLGEQPELDPPSAPAGGLSFD
jgi:hypothetical protein